MNKDLLNRWLESRRSKDQKAEAAPDNKHPLAHNQQSLYFLCQRYPQNPFYNLAEMYRFPSGLDIEAYIEAFRFLTKQHDILRTKFLLEEGRPVQTVQPDAHPEVIRHTLQEPQNAAEESERLLKEDARRPFDLDQPCQLRLSIVQGKGDHYVVGVIVHHIIMDMWSMGALMDEVSGIYQKIVAGQAPELRELPMRYGQYAEDQTNRPLDATALQYWYEKLKDTDDPLHLPTDFQRPPAQSFKGGVVSTRISPEVGAGIRALGKQYNVTSFVVLLSLYYILLYKYSGRKNISIGVPFSKKHARELEAIIGFFDETLVLRTEIGDVTYSEFINRVKTTVFEGFEQSHVPLEEIVKALKPDRHPGINPLFQVMFIYYKLPQPAGFGHDLPYSAERLDIGISKFDLSLFVGENESGYSLSFEYASDLFRRSTVQSFAGHYINLLHQVTENPDAPVKHLRLLSDSESDQMLHAWNDTAVRFETDRDILQRIGRQVEQVPDHVAVADCDSRITYATLHEESEKVAHYLIRQGIDRGNVVALVFDRSADMIMSMLGVMKAGAAYVPIDPEYPARRIRHMIDDAGVAAIITAADLAEKVEGASCPIFRFDTLLRHAPATVSTRQVEGHGLAYVIYTSGSTGIPKGVAVTHANLLNSTLARHQYYADRPKRFLLLSSFSFDSSVAGIFWTLSTGGTLVISGKRIEQDLDRLAKVFHQEKVSHTLLLPTLYRELLLSIPVEHLQSLECVIVAGESCHAQLPGDHFGRLPEAKLYNEYGPTEATVWSTVKELDSREAGTVSVGTPIANTQVYILDPDMQPVPPGIPGEMYIGGLNVTQGYLNNEAATAKSFIANPFSRDNTLLYRTGDLGKYRRDGEIVFLGRRDAQVKIRGHRIELGEIEKHVIRHPDVKECTVKFVGANGLGERIVCYYTRSAELDPSALRSFLGEELPHHMIPSAFIHVEEMPRLPNGKLDTGKLQSHDSAPVDREVLRPTNEMERTLHQVWTEVLGNDSISIHDNFFEIGGDSIVSIRIISKARSRGLGIKPNQIFEHQTIYDLAKNLTYELDVSGKLQVGFVGESTTTPFQHRILQTSGFSVARGMEAYRVGFSVLIPDLQFQKIMQAIVDGHEALRQTFNLGRGISKVNYRSFKAADYMESASADRLEEDIRGISASISLEDGPLFRMVLIRNHAQRDACDAVMLLAHPLILDPQSRSTLIKMLVSHVEDYTGNKDRAPADASAAGFENWARMITSEELQLSYDEELAHWKSEIETEQQIDPGALQPPRDYTSRVQSISGSLFQRSQDEALNAYSLEAQELLLIAYTLTVGEYIGRSKVVVWTETDGRTAFKTAGDFTNSLGCFSSYFPLAVQLGPDLKSTITGVKDKIRSVPSAGIGYDYLRFVRAHRDLDVTEEFVFNFSGPVLVEDRDILVSVERGAGSGYFRTAGSGQSVELRCELHGDHIDCLFQFDSGRFDGKAADTFVMDYEKQLEAIVKHCSMAERQYTPGDFPDADLSEDDLDAILGQI